MGLVAALVLSGAAVVSFVSFAPSKAAQAGAAAPAGGAAESVAVAALAAPAPKPAPSTSVCDVEIEVTSSTGSISDLAGTVTKYSNRLWTVQSGSRSVVVEKDDDTLTVNFSDSTPDTVLTFLAGDPEDFMDTLADSGCGSCNDMNCCIEHCGAETGLKFCWCTAKVTCGANGVSHFCWSQSGGCEFTCNTP